MLELALPSEVQPDTYNMPGFKMGKAYLRGLRMHVPLAGGFYFRDDGYVPSLAEHAQRVGRELELLSPIIDYTQGRAHFAFTKRGLPGFAQWGIVIFHHYDMPQTTPWRRWYAWLGPFFRAQGETRMLLYTNTTSVLEEKLLEQGFDMSRRPAKYSELLNAMGLYALRIRGLDISDTLLLTPDLRHADEILGEWSTGQTRENTGP